MYLLVLKCKGSSSCVSFPQPGDDIVFMAQTLEKIFLQKVSQMPKEECDVVAIIAKEEERKSNAGIYIKTSAGLFTAKSFPPVLCMFSLPHVLQVRYSRDPLGLKLSSSRR